jgi:hypothetical protein
MLAISRSELPFKMTSPAHVWIVCGCPVIQQLFGRARRRPGCYTPMSSKQIRLFPTVNYWIDFARHVLAERGAMCPGERRGGLSGAGGSSFAKGEAQQGARRGQRNRTQTGIM